MIEFKSQLVQISDAELEVFSAGEGEAVFVCTHPYKDPKGPYPSGGLTDALARCGRTFYVCPRGTGGSTPEERRDKLTLAQLARDMEEVRAALGVTSWTPAGSSTGGMTALQYAVNFPDRVDGLVLVCTGASYRVFDDPDCIYNPGNPHFLAEQEARLAGTEAAFGDKWLTTILDLSVHNKAVLPNLIGNMKVSAIRADVDREELLDWKWDVEPYLKDIAAPVVVIAGRHDVQSPLIASYTMVRQIETSEFVIFNGSGHFPYEEEPERFRQVIADFAGRRLKSRGRDGWPA